MKALARYFIEGTGRETLPYRVAQAIKYKLATTLNVRNRLLREQRIRHAFAQSADSIKVQFGAGSGKYGVVATHIAGFIDTDILGHIPVDITRRLPFADNSVRTLFTSHVIEHIYQKQIERYLQECYRVLVPAGTVITATPSLQKLCRLLYGNDEIKRGELYDRHADALLGRRPTPARILNCMTHINYGHKFLLDFETFRDLAESVGLRNVRSVTADEIDDPGLHRFFQDIDDAYWLETEIYVATKTVQ